jgi:hypothetical protein
MSDHSKRPRARRGTTEPLPDPKPRQPSKKAKSRKRHEKNTSPPPPPQVNRPVVARVGKRYSPWLDEAAKLRGYESYEDYLSSAAWTKLHQRIAEAYGEERCLACGYPVVCLHHISYKRLCCESLSDVVQLCARCHSLVHARHKRDGIKLSDFYKAIRNVFRWSPEQANDRLKRYLELKVIDDYWRKVGEDKARKKRILYNAIDRIKVMVDAKVPTDEIAFKFHVGTDEMDRFILANFAPFWSSAMRPILPEEVDEHEDDDFFDDSDEFDEDAEPDGWNLMFDGAQIVMTTNNPEEEDWRMTRLHRVIGHVCAMATLDRKSLVLTKVKAMNDHKGQLTVTWTCDPTGREKTYFTKAWESIIGDGCDNIIHEF